MSQSGGWPKLHSPEDADATHRWARECLEMWEAEREALMAERDRALELLRGLVEPESDPCSFDHHGYCQAHGWFGEPGECGVREARQLLGLDDDA
jgi:hypothetical protein